MRPNPLRDLSERHDAAARVVSGEKLRTQHVVRSGDLEGLALTVDAWADEVRADERARVEGEIVAWIRGRIPRGHCGHQDNAALADAIEAGAHRAKGGT